MELCTAFRGRFFRNGNSPGETQGARPDSHKFRRLDIENFYPTAPLRRPVLQPFDNCSRGNWLNKISRGSGSLTLVRPKVLHGAGIFPARTWVAKHFYAACEIRSSVLEAENLNRGLLTYSCEIRRRLDICTVLQSMEAVRQPS